MQATQAEAHGLAEPSSYVDAKSETKLDLEWVERVSNTQCIVRGTPDEETGEVKFYNVTRCDRQGNWSWTCDCPCGSMQAHVTCCHKLAAAKAYDDPSRFVSEDLSEGLAEFERELAELEGRNNVGPGQANSDGAARVYTA